MDNPKTLHFILFLLALRFFLIQAAISQDLKLLLDFKAHSDKANKLAWNPCSWNGVSCLRNRVSQLVLENLELSGLLKPLSSLSQLRVLSVKNNRFAGEFPETVQSLFRLSRLDLSFNNFSGQIPLTINRLTHLSALRLEGNIFSGQVSGLALPNLQDPNVSGNHLSGQIPKSLSRFPESAFTQNVDLCGSPVRACKTPLNQGNNPTTVISSSPSSIPTNKDPDNKLPSLLKSISATVSSLAVIAIVITQFLVVVVIPLLLCRNLWKSYVEDEKRSKLLESEKS